MQWGNYSGYPTKTVTALEGIRQQLGNIPYIVGCDLTRNENVESRFAEIKAPLGNQGMQATYYNNTNMSGKPVTTVTLTEPIKLSNGGNTVFASGVNLENFSARLDGTFIPTRDETLIFNISGDDKIRLLVNGDTIIDIWKARQRIQNDQKEMTVKTGQHYRIQIDYVQESGYGALNFDIQHKSTPTPQELMTQVGDAETIIFIGGISPRLEGEEMRVSEPGFRGGDRTSIELPQAQRDVLRWLHEAGKKVIFVNCSGSAIGLEPENQNTDAILQAWYGGEAGGKAVADVLFGKFNPCGKLPITFYKNAEQLPDFLDYNMKGRTYRYFKGAPLYPFGYGLSYTTFSFGKPSFRDGKVKVSVKNTGTSDGSEVVQVYVRNPKDVEGPLKTLRGFKRVCLKAGESKIVEIPMPREQFELWDTQTNTMRVVPGKYEVMVGNSSANSNLQKITINIK
jgi:beta-glucosidase